MRTSALGNTVIGSASGVPSARVAMVTEAGAVAAWVLGAQASALAGEAPGAASLDPEQAARVRAVAVETVRVTKLRRVMVMRLL